METRLEHQTFCCLLYGDNWLGNGDRSNDMGNFGERTSICIFFPPLALIFVEILGSLVLDEKLHLGSIIGSVLIVVGLYIVLWGKSKEMMMNQCTSETTSGITELADHRGEGKSSSAIEDV
ncbi:hypothetical protein BUALT_Bualt04G0010400 [Buddleja alternifolia]|uniref:WAT1-related protein n=1 Tax=Buddleja alternifolia TaxID=168488 RepID=A0AAV6XWL2_9LAMI|nr:hypothetical protein BUALT_Bualt04G0010400 [Buddleja alternifolia]